MEYNVKLINVYTMLRHSDLLNRSVCKYSMDYFQETLNKSIPTTPTERLVFQTHRKLLKVSVQDSISIITNTKLWHLCLCAPIPVLRTILKVPDSVVIVYNKSTGYCVTSNVTNEEFPTLDGQSSKPADPTTDEQSQQSNAWVNVAKRQPTNDASPLPTSRRAPRQSRQPRKQEKSNTTTEKPVKILARGSTLVASVSTSQPPAVLIKQVSEANKKVAEEESLDNAIKKLKEMPSQNWADMEEEDAEL